MQRAKSSSSCAIDFLETLFSAKKLKHKFPHTLDRLMMIHGALDKHSLQLFSNKLDRRSVSDGEWDKFFGQECKLARKFESAIAHFTHTHSRSGILQNFFIFLVEQTKLRRDDTRGCDGAMESSYWINNLSDAILLRIKDGKNLKNCSHCHWIWLLSHAALKKFYRLNTAQRSEITRKASLMAIILIQFLFSCTISLWIIALSASDVIVVCSESLPSFIPARRDFFISSSKLS